MTAGKSGLDGSGRDNLLGYSSLLYLRQGAQCRLVGGGMAPEIVCKLRLPRLDYVLSWDIVQGIYRNELMNSLMKNIALLFQIAFPPARRQ